MSGWSGRLAGWWRPALLLGLSAGLGAAACPKTDATGPKTSGVFITPTAVSLHTGQQVTFHAYGRTAAGDSVAVTVTFTATGGSITAGGVYTAGGSAGSFHAIATVSGGTASDTASITISLVPVATVTVTPAHPSIPAGTTIGLSATTRDSSSNVLSGRVVTWSSGTTSVGTVDANGVVTGVAAGTTVITATSEGVQGKDTVTVTTPTATLVRVILTPDSVALDTGHTAQFSVLGKFSDSSTATIPVTYSATGGSVNGSGLYTAGTTAGTFRVIATGGGGTLADTSKVVISLPTLVRVILTPDSTSVDTGHTAQFSTVGKFSDSSTAAVTVTYSATGGTINTSGLYTAGTTAGTFRVIAVKSGGTLADTSKVVVTAPTLVRVILTPDSTSVDTGHTAQFSTVGKFSDSSTAAVTVTYSATGGTINTSGLYTAGTTAGTFRVIAVKSGGTLADTSKVVVTTAAPSAAECASPQAGWIWCDDFEQDRLASYFEYDNPGGNFTRVAGVGKDGSYGMKGHFTAGASSAGDLHLAFGKTPSSYFAPVDAGTANYREIYWRMYVKAQAGWVGAAHDKLSRALIFGNANFGEAIAAHVWGGDVGSADTMGLILDPASGVDSAGNLVAVTYNDPNLKYLGQAKHSPHPTPIFDAAHVGQWYCVEAHVKLNDAGFSNGVFELWINDSLEAQKTGMNWVSSYSAFGINAVYFENYWNDGATVAEDRFFDNIVVSTQRIGC